MVSRSIFRILQAFALAGVAWLIGSLGKMIIAAPRPFALLAEVRELIAYGEHDAFPSGHATFYFALAAALFAHDKKLGLMAFAVAAFIGLARIAAGVHWPTDILAGALLGSAIGLIANRLITYYTARR